MSPSIDWDLLRGKAKEVMAGAYAPYSDFPVGAAGLLDDGRIAVGCNVENVSYGLGMCAECALAGDLRRLGGRRLVAVSVSDRRGAVLMPCGRCRQILLEHGGPGLLIDHVDGPLPLGELLPYAFSPDDIAASRSGEA